MNWTSGQMEQFMSTGLLETGIAPMDRTKMVTCLRDFMSQHQKYRYKYLQKNFDYAFEGYSYLGQTDSTNQGVEDLVHTYVISDFFSPEKHAKEMGNIFGQELNMVKQLIRHLVGEIDTSLIDFFENHCGQMLSANYYPDINKADHSPRLSSHPDISLVTCFPFGTDESFAYKQPDGSWHSLSNPNQIILFSGHLMELMKGIPALAP